jgi:hypothetical protein
VHFDSLNAYTKQLGNLFCILPFRDQLQNFALPKAELLQLTVSAASLVFGSNEIGYLDSLPHSLAQSDREMVNSSSVENLLSSGKHEREAAGHDNWLTRQH